MAKILIVDDSEINREILAAMLEKRYEIDMAKDGQEAIEILEKNMQQLAALTSSVEKLAYSIEGMVKEQESQGNRLEKLESKDGEKWRSVSSYVITVIIGLVLGYIFQQAGM